MKTGQLFIPYQLFAGQYLECIRDIGDELTRTQKRMLILLNEYAFKDGLCYPAQKTLASRLGVKERQVRNILKALETDGWIEVERTTPLRRHLYGAHNKYWFRWHPGYLTTLRGVRAASQAHKTGEIASEMQPQPFYKSEKKTHPLPSGEIVQLITPGGEGAEKTDFVLDLGKRLDSDCVFGKFSAFRFSQWALHHFADFPAVVIETALTAIEKRYNSGMDRAGVDWWAYGVTVIKRRGPEAKAEQEKQQTAGMYEALGKLFGGCAKKVTGGATG